MINGTKLPKRIMHKLLSQQINHHPKVVPSTPLLQGTVPIACREESHIVQKRKKNSLKRNDNTLISNQVEIIN
jgi:hypothetical protein